MPNHILSLKIKSLLCTLVGQPLIKTYIDLLSSFVELKKTHPDLFLVLVGKKDSNYKKLAKWVEDKAIPDVIFTGFIEDSQLKWLYENCQAYVFPSLSEGFGLPGLEAMNRVHR